MDEDQFTKNAVKVVIGVMFLFILLIALFGAFYIVDAGERAVLLTLGKASPIPSEPGLHFKIPIVQKIKKLEVRTRKIETNSDSASKDLQDVQTTIALNYHLIPGETPQLYQKIGLSYQERIIDPSIQESIKAVTAQFTAEELITKRPEVRRNMQIAVSEKLTKYHIQVDDFNVVNFQFSEEFDNAIEAKVTAEQQMLKAQKDLERIIIEKEQTIRRAEAEAESLRLQKQEITPDLIKLRQIEVQMEAVKVQREAVAKWSGDLPLITGGAIPFIDIKYLEERGNLEGEKSTIE